MSANTTNESARYFSRYTFGVDEKRRIQIPARWRSGDGEAQFALVLWDNGSAGPCLRVYPPKQMDALLEKIGTMSNSDPLAVALRRNIAKHSEMVTLDKSGRICLPEELAVMAQIEPQKPAKLVGALQWFEIWNPERYEGANNADDALAPEAVKQI